MVQQPYSTWLVQDYVHSNQFHGCDENGKYGASSGTRTHISGILGQCATITPHRLPDVTTIPTPTWVCGPFASEVSADYYTYINLSLPSFDNLLFGSKLDCFNYFFSSIY